MTLAIANHLWQSTLFAAVAGLLALALRNQRAQVRQWIWLAASVKFLIPFSLLIGVGNRVPLRAPMTPPEIAFVMEEISQPFAPPSQNHAPAEANPLPLLLLAVWSEGLAIVFVFWCKRWRRIRLAVKGASPLPLETCIPVKSSRGLLEPGVFGIFRPVLLLPEGIAERLTPEQLKAVLAHELCHARRQDNLTAAAHMLVEGIFWFHPAVWWIGGRLVEERELACDEEVLRSGSEPQVYAESILRVCRFYLESPLICVSGITGADLKKRIEQIMLHRVVPQLGLGRSLLLTGIALTSVAWPVLVGMSRAQTQTPATEKLEFEVATIKPNKSASTRVSIQRGPGYLGTNISLRNLISFAYGVRPNELSGAPSWLDNERFDVTAKALRGATDEQRRRMMQSLLAERFKLAVHRETKEMPVYALVVAKNGPKLQLSKAEETEFGGGPGKYVCQKVHLTMLAAQLQRLLGHRVTDQTGLSGEYDFKLEWTPDPPAADATPIGEIRTAPMEQTGPSIFTAIQEQLGLKLESRKGPVEFLVVDRVERVPTEN